jgi:serine/threonine protein kinase
VLVPIAHPALQLVSVPGYEIEEELERQNTRYRDFIGRHRLLRSRGRVRIKSYTVDPLMGASARRGMLNRTLRDMEALQVLDGNPYVARAYEILQDQEDELVFYMVSEWVGSETLEDFIAEDGGRGGWQLWHYMEHLCLAVSSMHRAGIVHRGLYPGVVYLQPEGSEVPVKVADFDFARVDMLDSIAGELGEIGRDGYAAPELLLGEGEHDERVDVFSVGAILYELVTGRALYEDVTWVLRHREMWQRQRLLVTDLEVRELLDGLLAAAPQERHPDLEATRRLCEVRAVRKERG